MLLQFQLPTLLVYHEEGLGERHELPHSQTFPLSSLNFEISEKSPSFKMKKILIAIIWIDNHLMRFLFSCVNNSFSVMIVYFMTMH